MPERPLSLALSSEGLFAGAEGYQGGLYYLQLVSKGMLSAPILVIASTPVEPFQPMSMQVIGDRLYLGYLGLHAYDITDPEQPERVWSAGGNIVRGFSLDGDQVFTFGWTILSEYVRHPIRAPEPITGLLVGIPGSVTDVHKGNFLVAYDTLEIYQLTLLSQTALPEVGVGVAIHTDWVLVAVGGDHGAAQLLIFDIQDPALPEQESALDLPVSQLNAVPMLMRGPHLILANGFGGVEVLRLEP